MTDAPSKLVEALGKYFDPGVPPEKQGRPIHKHPATLLFFIASADPDEPVEIQLTRVEDKFEVLVVLGDGSTCYHGSPLFADTEESGREMIEWIKSR